MSKIKAALLSSWLFTNNIFALMGILAIGWYQYLIFPMLTSIISFATLRNLKSKILLGIGLLLGAVLGVTAKALFFIGPGISSDGMVLTLMPLGLYVLFAGLRVYYLEDAEVDRDA